MAKKTFESELIMLHIEYDKTKLFQGELLLLEFIS